MNLINSLIPRNLFLYSPDPAGGGSAETDSGTGGGDKPAEKADEHPEGEKHETPEEKKFSQADVDRILKERLERERKKSEEAAAKLKADAEAKTLAEKGEFKELAEKEKAEREKAETELRSLKLQGAFEKSARKLNVEFQNENAAKDAFAKLDAASVGDDLKGMDDAVKKLLKDYPYLFKEISAEEIDATVKGKETVQAVNEQLVKSKQRDGRYAGF